MEGLVIELDPSLYQEDVVLRTAYQFTAACRIEVGKTVGGRIVVSLSDSKTEQSLDVLEAEFRRALIDFALRKKIEVETRPIREEFIRAALASVGIKD